jgi:DNA primase
MSVIEEIKDRLDLVSYVQNTVTMKKAGRNYKANCPFHNENTPSFVVSPEKQTWRCYGACAEGGDIFAFAQKQHGWTFPEALRELGKLAGVEIKQSYKSKRTEHLLGILEHVAESYNKLLMLWDKAQHCRDYLTGRQFADETIELWQLGYAPPGWETASRKLLDLGYQREDLIAAGICNQNDSGNLYDFFRNRFMIPIHDHRGRVVGFGARRLDETERAKYINSPQSDVFNKSQILFGLDKAKAIDDTIVVVEGYLDVIRAHQVGLTNVVGQLGTALTDEQINRLQRKGKRIVVALDGDGAGNTAALHAAESLVALEGNIRAAILPEGKDPDDVMSESKALWESIISQSVPIAEYLISERCKGIDLNTPIAEREIIARELLPILLQNENKIYRLDYLQRLSARLRIPEMELSELPAFKSSPKQHKRATKPHPRKMAADERFVLLGTLNHQATIMRYFREVNIPVFEAADFSSPECVQLYELLSQAHAQFDMDILEYVNCHIDPELIEAWDALRAIDPPGKDSQERVAYYALRLRFRRLEREVDDLTEVNLLDHARELLQQKQRAAGKLQQLFKRI